MTGNDLKTLVTEIKKEQAINKALNEALNDERQAFSFYENKVNTIIKQQETQRKQYEDEIKQLKKQLNSPALELYTGYNHDDGFEGGIRLVWRVD